jgi:NAD(P)-dependent dehydrogenase (short-subunit alcohol dehydrogenase family)
MPSLNIKRRPILLNLHHGVFISKNRVDYRLGEAALGDTKLTSSGANQGIGYEAAKNLVLSSLDYHVLVGSRDVAKGTTAVSTLQALPGLKGSISLLQIDVTDDASVDSAAVKIQKEHGRLDILVNNSGIGSSHNYSIRDAMKEVYAVNVFGVVSVTEAFIPLLRRSSKPRLIFVSSTTGSITIAADPNSPLNGGGAIDYRSSKAALNMLMVLYCNRLKGEGFMVHGVNPGLIATNFHGGVARPGARPEVGGGRVAKVVKGERDADVGKVCGADGVLPW